MIIPIYALFIIPILYLIGWIIWYYRYGGIPKKSPKIISFHKITNSPELGGTFCFEKQFDIFMKYISEHYNTVSIEEALNNYNEKNILIFFDDAYEDIYKIAFPIMKEYNLKGVLCPVVNYIGEKNFWDRGINKYKHMNFSQLKEMQEYGFEIVSHSLNHYDMRKLYIEEIEKELLQSKEILEKQLKIKVEYFLYPYGLYNEKIKRILRKIGYKGAFTSYNKDNRVFDKYAIGRNTMYIIDTKWDLSIILNRKPLFLYGHEEAKGRIINWFARFSGVIKGL